MLASVLARFRVFQQLHQDTDGVPRVPSFRMEVHMRTIRWLLICLLFYPSLAGAQTSWEPVKALATGTQIRILQAGGRITSGQLQSADDAQVVVSTVDRISHIPRSEVQQVEFIKSNIRRRTLLGLTCGVGLGIVGAFGAGLGGANPAVPALLFPVAGVLIGRSTAQREFVVVYRNPVP